MSRCQLLKRKLLGKVYSVPKFTLLVKMLEKWWPANSLDRAVKQVRDYMYFNDYAEVIYVQTKKIHVDALQYKLPLKADSNEELLCIFSRKFFFLIIHRIRIHLKLLTQVFKTSLAKQSLQSMIHNVQCWKKWMDLCWAKVPVKPFFIEKNEFLNTVCLKI